MMNKKLLMLGLVLGLVSGVVGLEAKRGEGKGKSTVVANCSCGERASRDSAYCNKCRCENTEAVTGKNGRSRTKRCVSAKNHWVDHSYPSNQKKA